MKPWFLVALAILGAAMVGCDRSDAEALSPTTVTIDTTTRVPVVDTTPKDTVVLVLPKRFPTVDSFVFSFVSVTGKAASLSKRILRKDSLVSIPLDTGTGRLWRLAVQGRKGERLWWSLDSIRVKPDSSRRIVLDSAWRRLVVADTSTPVVVVPKDTSLYVPLSALAGDTILFAESDRGLFLRYDAGILSLSLVSDGNYPGVTQERVTNARFALSFSRAGAADSVPWLDPSYNGRRDNDSISRVQWTRNAGAVNGVAGNLFARFLPKVLAIPVSRCTVEVAVTFRSGIQSGAGWATSPVPSDSAPGLLFLGASRIHPTKTNFKIVIP